MEIKCTVNEFAAMVKGCAAASSQFSCTKCPLYEVCDRGGIEQFVSAANVIEEEGATCGPESD